MQEWCGGIWSRLPREWGRKMHDVHKRFYYQPRQNRVHSYVHVIACKINYQHSLTLSDCPHSGFVANLCSCENGQASPGDFGGCLVNGAAKCNLCDPGWTLNHERTKCIRTFVCFFFKCSTCNPGWTANHDNTKCIRKCQDWRVEHQ